MTRSGTLGSSRTKNCYCLCIEYGVRRRISLLIVGMDDLIIKKRFKRMNWSYFILEADNALFDGCL